jgi:HPt (histidine-containing phosphotransfer) domain-containing protein
VGAEAKAALPAENAVDVNVLVALVGSDRRVLRELLGQFRTSAAQAALELAEACSTSSAVGAEAVAHRLKSSARSVGALALGERCAEIEAAGTSRDVAAIKSLYAGFAEEMVAVQLSLDSLCAQEG